AQKFLKQANLEAEIRVKEVQASGKGSILFLTAEFENVRAGFSSLGEKGLPAEKVSESAVNELKNYLGKSVCLDHYLADQLIPYVALCKTRIEMNVSKITNHLLTNLWVVKRFLPIQYELKGPLGYPGTLIIEPAVIPPPAPPTPPTEKPAETPAGT
ncbi:MAG: hypothetical protein E4G91_11165, partial [Candidatus Zixiibacteriota bacterium]